MNTDYDHVDDKELRDILIGDTHVDIEQQDYCCSQTIASHVIDECDPTLNLEEHVWSERNRLIEIIHESWDGSEEGNARAVKACQAYWKV